MMAGREAEKADDRHGTHVPSVQGVTDNYIYITKQIHNQSIQQSNQPTSNQTHTDLGFQAGRRTIFQADQLEP